jgi:hypothetical protein
MNGVEPPRSVPPSDDFSDRSPQILLANPRKVQEVVDGAHFVGGQPSVERDLVARVSQEPAQLLLLPGSQAIGIPPLGLHEPTQVTGMRAAVPQGP